MIRVVYRWRVEPQNLSAFTEVWTATTNRIHETVPGALGSFMLRGCDDEADVITLAKWDSLESWRAFWGSSDPEDMQEMRRLGERLSAVAYEEVGDHTR